MTEKALKKKLDRQRVKNLERALKTERTGLLAMGVAFCREGNNPAGLLARLDAMASAVANDGKAPGGLRESIVNGRAIVEQAIALESGRPQKLFEPDVGHSDPAQVAALVDAPPEQLSLNGSEERLTELNAFEAQVEAGLLETLQQAPLADDELYERYHLVMERPRVTRASLAARRRALAARGFIARIEHEGLTKWTTIERTV
jgi:hypothetical protein